jgi:hypothetical protein
MITTASNQSFLHATKDRTRMEAEFMANDKALPRSELLDLATLLHEARSIEHDLTGRLFQHPKNKSLLKQRKQYRQLVRQLASELERATCERFGDKQSRCWPGG